jgi:hypothetical protein
VEWDLNSFINELKSISHCLGMIMIIKEFKIKLRAPESAIVENGLID